MVAVIAVIGGVFRSKCWKMLFVLRSGKKIAEI